MPEERSQQQKEWLKHNADPFSQVQEYMKDTVLYRANWIRANNSKDIQEILDEYPRLTSPGMITQDFLVLYGEAAPKLFETWMPTYAEQVLHLAEKDGKLPSFPLENMTSDARGELALRLLPVMMPHVTYRDGKKTKRFSVEESRSAFIDHKPVGTNMVQYLQAVRRPYPSVLVLGEPQECSTQSFVVFEGQAFAQNTLLGAVDVCFKAFYVFDINYPKQCAPAWEFVQQVYGIEGPVCKQAKFFMTAVQNTKL